MHGPSQSTQHVFLPFCFFQSPSTFYHATFAQFPRDYSMFLKYTLPFHLCPPAHAIVPFFCCCSPFSPWSPISNQLSIGKTHRSLLKAQINVISYMELLPHIRQSHSLLLKQRNKVKEDPQDGGLCPSLTHFIIYHTLGKSHSWTLKSPKLELWNASPSALKGMLENVNI